MSLQQIVREFPFLSFDIQDDPKLSKDVIIEARISRLSLDSLELTLEDIPSDGKTALFHYFDILDKAGHTLPGQTSPLPEFSTLGEALCYSFRHKEDREWIQMVYYIKYNVDHEVARWHRFKGGKAKCELRTQHREIIIFKMPKKLTLWQLLAKYRKNRR